MSYQGIPPALVKWFFANDNDSKNGCGQAAVAFLLDITGKSPYTPDVAVREIYRRHPPDTPGALLGTTPGHLENTCRAYGMTTYRYCNNESGAQSRLRQTTALNRPTAVLLDIGRLGGQWGFHYPVVHGYDDHNVYLTNMVPTKFGQDPRQIIPWGDYMYAWWCWIPGGDFKYAGIEAWFS